MNDSSLPVKVVFVAGGQGAQYLGMGLDLYRNDERFRNHLQTALPTDDPTLNSIRISWESQDDRSKNSTPYVQTLLAALGFASARRLYDMGLVPDVLLGHSAGEFALACSSGLIDDAELSRVLRQRAIFLDGIEVPGAMVAIRASEREVQRIIEETASTVFIATVNSVNQCVVAGEKVAVANFCAEAKRRSILAVAAESELPFHTPLMQGPADSFAAILSSAKLKPLVHPLFSTVTCSWLTPAEAVSACFWASHLSRPVQFWRSIEALLQDGDCVFIDLGPGTSLSAILGSHPSIRHGESRVISLMPQRSAEPGHQLWMDRARAIVED
ncbi:acyltransferase domain-containing protein [Leucobacter sp. M11]|uniref:acyltransferase domain-containing protein n=1 Tax=Leucobacter sp. M11 TaxID=2993565 RepID=UPI002D80AC3D|nr:acyltransferase domain-containing protein [Leucobacter sp. M11]MEB4613746.1 acyltransferase domain-containing protein [Leucobacter sp. M11]